MRKPRVTNVLNLICASSVIVTCLVCLTLGPIGGARAQGGGSVAHMMGNLVAGVANKINNNRWLPGIKNILGGLQVRLIIVLLVKLWNLLLSFSVSDMKDHLSLLLMIVE